MSEQIVGHSVCETKASSRDPILESVNLSRDEDLTETGCARS